MVITTPLSGTLRILSGLTLMVGAVYAGYQGRSAWIIPLLGLAYMIAYIAGRWRRWAIAARTRGAGYMRNAALMTWPIQCVLVGILYLIGYGLGAMFEGHTAPPDMRRTDYMFAAVFGGIGAVAGLVIALIEIEASGPPRAKSAPSTDAGDTAEDIRLLPTPVTPDSLIRGIHYSHGTYTKDPDGFDGTPNAASAGGDDKIAATEARLGRVLPEGLRAIYRIHNGGNVDRVCIPNDGASAPLRYNDVLMPFSGYDDLNPLERLQTAWQSFEAFGDPDDQETYGSFFSNGTENMVVLAQWYRETLFLDYNRPGPPRVGFTDFDDEDNWPQKARYWPDFETFFAALRHYKEV